jgi:gamma-glutamyl-gamma-aminobutyrate hydrolase PuuD
MSAVNKNTNIRNMVEKYNSTRVNFIEYDSVDDLELKLKNMANNDSDGLCIIIENDEQIE